MVRASASQSVDLGFISLNKPIEKTLKNGTTAFLLSAQRKWDGAENKSEISHVVSLGKVLNVKPTSLRSSYVAGPCSVPAMVAQLN